jgi:hypothetical protein
MKEQENKDLTLLTEELKDEILMNKILEIEKLGREIRVGQMTTFQKQEFVTNETEYPIGTVERSRQAIFEASVRISNLRGGVYDFHKAQAEIKIEKAKKLRAEAKLAKAADEADKLEAEGEIQLAEIDIARKTNELGALKYKADAWLDDVKDFYVTFLKNETVCKEKGKSILDWNNFDAQIDYWSTVMERKIQKQLSYDLMARTQQQGDSLPFQNNTQVMMKYVGNIFPLLPDTKKEEIKQMATRMGITIEEKPQLTEKKDESNLPQ